jgi:hypothetical protein
MAYIEVEVNLDEFDLDELLEEIEDRCSHSERNKKEVLEFCIDLLNEPKNPSFSLLDQMKIDLLLNNLNKITLNDLENLL